MKAFKYYIILAFSGAVIASSCGKKLDLVPINSIEEDFAFPDVPSLERGILGVHASFNGTYDDQIYAATLYADEASLPAENNTGRGVIAYRWQVDPGNAEVTDAWYSYYAGIDRANRVLFAADTITPKTAAEQTTLNRVTAEALGLRAFGHLQLLINYAENYDAASLGVPYMEQSIISTPARQTVGEVFTKIYADIDKAIPLMPSNYTTNGRLTLATLHAIKARAALYRKDWPTAITAATAAINIVPLATRAEYPGIWTDANNSEVIWEQKRLTGEARLGDVFYDRSQGLIMYSAAEKLRNTFNQNNDVRYVSTVFVRGADRFSIGKYTGDRSSSNGEPGRVDVKVFRTAEMYLIRAEAYAESTPMNLTAAATDINTLRAVRINGYVNESFATKNEAITAIMNERFKELAFEGHRIFDLRRKLLPVNRVGSDVGLAFGAVNLLPTDKEYYFPIPQGEILANDNMIQNPTYRN